MNEQQPQFFSWLPPDFSAHAGAEKTSLFPRAFMGRWRSGEEMPPVVDEHVFKSVCHTAARLLNGKVVQFDFASVTPNFHRALIEWGFDQQRVAVLCNRAYFLVAFCKPRSDLTNEYVDSPEVAETLAKICDWRLLSKAELETVIDDAMLASMSEQDRRVIEKARRKGWVGPCRTVGDVIFHDSD